MAGISRDPEDLHPKLKQRWEWMQAEWKRRYPDDPQPFLITTYRPVSEQQALYDSGASKAKPMQSLHNFLPALAFDVTFDPDLSDGIGNDATWTFKWFEQWGRLAEEAGLEWGGRWPGLVDGPHVQWPVKWQAAQAGHLPPLKSFPTQPSSGSEWKVVYLWEGATLAVRDLPKDMDVLVRYAPERKRVYIDARREDI